jgi:hypothetical protein
MYNGNPNITRVLSLLEQVRDLQILTLLPVPLFARVVEQRTFDLSV